VLTGLLSPFATTNPDAPVESPVAWVMAAAARREVGVDAESPALLTAGVQDTTSLLMTSLAANQPPSVTVITPAPNGAGVVNGQIIAFDPDRDAITYSGTTTTSKGTVVVSGSGTRGRFTYTPTDEARHAAAADGATAADKTDTFTITVDDGHGNQLPFTITVDIRGANSRPTKATVTSLTTDTATGVVTGTMTATDPDGDTFTVTGPANTNQGSIIYADNTFTYIPTFAARQAASSPRATTVDKTDRFIITISDGHGGTTITQVTVDITPLGATTVNQPPTANPTFGAPQGLNGVVTGNLNFSDPDGDTVTYTLAIPPLNGEVTLGAGGSFSYTPSTQARLNAAGGHAMYDQFTVQLSDGQNPPVTVEVARIPISSTQAVVVRSFPIALDSLLPSWDTTSTNITAGDARIYVYKTDVMYDTGHFAVYDAVTGVKIAEHTVPRAGRGMGITNDGLVYTILSPAFDDDRTGVQVFDANTGSLLRTIYTTKTPNTIRIQGNRAFVVFADPPNPSTFGEVVGNQIIGATQADLPPIDGERRSATHLFSGSGTGVLIYDWETGDLVQVVNLGGPTQTWLGPDGKYLYARTSTADGLVLHVLQLSDVHRPFAASPGGVGGGVGGGGTTSNPSPVTAYTDYSSGVTAGYINVPPPDNAPGTTYTYEGSTESPLGSFVVNQDGTFAFTPTTEARNLAAESGKVNTVLFLVKATDSMGNSHVVPVTITLWPSGYPSEPGPTPMRFLDFIELPGAVGFWDRLGQNFEVRTVGGGKDENGDWDYATQSVKRIGNPPLMTDPDTGMPVMPETYVVSVLVAKETTPGGAREAYVIGYRKMNYGDVITLRNDYPQESSYVTFSNVDFLPGTFPTELFKTRIEGVVGGYIFNNEIPEDLCGCMQYLAGSDAISESVLQVINGRAATEGGIRWGSQKAKELLSPIADGRLRLGGAVILGVKAASAPGEALELVPEWQEEYRDESYSTWLIQGPDLADCPELGIPTSNSA